MKKNHLHKIFIALLFLGTISPLQSQAFWGVGDTVTDIGANAQLAIINGTAANTTSNTTLSMVKEYVLDGLAYSIAQKLSQKLVAKVLNKVNGGASQNQTPNFITNFGQYFGDISGKQISEYTTNLYGSNNPFAKSISVGLVNATSGYGNTGLSGFSLDKILPSGVKWQDAATNISTAGNKGWDFYNELSKPENTPFGSAMIAQDQLTKKIQKAQDVARTELTSAGYKAQKVKATIFDNYSTDSGFYYDKFKKGLNDALDKNIAEDKARAAAAANYSPADTTSLTGEQAITLGSAPSISAFGSSSAWNSGGLVTNEDYSSVANLNKPIQAPQANVANQVNNSSEETKKRLQDADSFFKLVFSTLTQLVSGLIESGISKLTSDAGAGTQKTYGSATDAQKAAVGVNGKRGSWLAGPEQIIDFRNEIENAINLTNLDLSYNQKTLDLIKAPVSGLIKDSNGTEYDEALQKLEQCIPGPDTGWEDRLQKYIVDQTKKTSNRASDDKKGKVNTDALNTLESQGGIAVQQENDILANPFFNIPNASAMQEIATSYYKNTKQFQSLFTALLEKKRLAVTLDSIKAQALAIEPSLILFEEQWNNLSQAQKDSAYQTASRKIVASFKATTQPGSVAGTTVTTIPANSDFVDQYQDFQDPEKIKDLPVDDPDTPDVNERENEKKKRVLDEQWYEWENVIGSEDLRQNLYFKYTSNKENVPTSKLVQQSKNRFETVVQQNLDLANTLHDCKIIRTATQNYQQYDDAKWNQFKQTLLSSTRKSFLPYTSIIGVALGKSAIDTKFDTILLPLDEYPGGLMGNSPQTGIYMSLSANYQDYPPMNNLQVPVAKTPADVLIQDDQQKLFCRFQNYFLYYWGPEDLTGNAIGCGGNQTIEMTDQSISHRSKSNPNWYRTNRAEIFYSLTTSNF